MNLLIISTGPLIVDVFIICIHKLASRGRLGFLGKLGGSRPAAPAPCQAFAWSVSGEWSGAGIFFCWPYLSLCCGGIDRTLMSLQALWWSCVFLSLRDSRGSSLLVPVFYPLIGCGWQDSVRRGFDGLLWIEVLRSDECFGTMRGGALVGVLAIMEEWMVADGYSWRWLESCNRGGCCSLEVWLGFECLWVWAVFWAQFLFFVVISFV